MQFTIAIIGGGFSGASVAIQLARHGLRDALVFVIERRDQVGKGIAYGTTDYSHLLNVRAKGMSAFAQEPDHFVRWLHEQLPDVYGSEDFVPRALYGDYIESLFREACDSSNLSVRQVQGEAISLERLEGRCRISLASGREIDADHVVLSTGHFPPGHPPGFPPDLYGHPSYASDPWATDALEGLKSGDRALLVGTGLTAIDLAFSAIEDCPGIELTLLSLTGAFPQVHAASTPMTFTELPSDLASLVKFVRYEIRKTGHWRSVFDGLRPHSGKLWSGFTERDKQRFMRFVRPYFERYRHRMAPEIAERLDGYVAAGTVRVLSGTVVSAVAQDDALQCTLRLAGGQERFETFERVVNCTGPRCDYRRMQHPLVKSLLGSGYIRPDPLNLGIEATIDGQVCDADGNPQDWFSTLGPTLKGNLWETTAVPEIRAQASALAQRLSAR